MNHLATSLSLLSLVLGIFLILSTVAASTPSSSHAATVRYWGV